MGCSDVVTQEKDWCVLLGSSRPVVRLECVLRQGRKLSGERRYRCIPCSRLVETFGRM